MALEDFPAPTEGFVLTNFLVVSDQDRSREFYLSLFGPRIVRERDPVILRVANSWLIMNAGGGPTVDKPGVTLRTHSPRTRRVHFSTCESRIFRGHTPNGQPWVPRSLRSRKTTEERSVAISATPMST
jgi:hypothetical protein